MNKNFPLINNIDSNEYINRSSSTKNIYTNPVALSNPNNAHEKLHFKSNSPYYVSILPPIIRNEGFSPFMSAHNFHINSEKVNEETKHVGYSEKIKEVDSKTENSYKNQMLESNQIQVEDICKTINLPEEKNNLNSLSTIEKHSNNKFIKSEILTQKHNMIRKIIYELKFT